MEFLLSRWHCILPVIIIATVGLCSGIKSRGKNAKENKDGETRINGANADIIDEELR
ncbi:MAG: hypothetical protein LBQ40_07250 [Clostridiales bacterium]|jgi:hypothetical protein|nr:hypothetical protein [Clostridiales bacterium]